MVQGACHGRATIVHALHTSGDSWYRFQSYIWQGLHILILLDFSWSPAIFMHISVWSCPLLEGDFHWKDIP